MSDVFDRAIKREEEARIYHEILTAASVNDETNNLFSVLAEAEREHHDALVELTGNLGPGHSQFKILRGTACLLKTSPGKA